MSNALKLVSVSIMLVTASYISLGQARLIEKVSRHGKELVIPFEKYELPNGLTVLIHEDHSDPIVHVDVTYHVGSAREQPGKSGFAHFFEHMMFQGSENVADDEHFKIVTGAGGTLNGSTNLDRTNYYQTLPVNQFETALWLEADRMGFFINAISNEKFEIQRATVKNERGQNVDNRPYGRMSEKMHEAIYPYSHPYSWPTIGWMEDIDRAELDDLKQFFLRYYGPNNAVLTISGDVQSESVIRFVEKYFSSIERGPEVKKAARNPATLTETRYISFEDNVRFPALQVSWPSVEAGHEDEPALDFLSDILGGGKYSFLYKKLVTPQHAMSASAYNYGAELAGSFSVRINTMPGYRLDEIARYAEEAFEDFERTGVSDEDLIRIKTAKEAQLINGLASVSGKASRLAYYHTYFNNPGFISNEMERYNKVTAQDVKRVYNKYIRKSNRVVLSVVPKGKSELIVAGDNFIPANFQTETKKNAEQTELTIVSNLNKLSGTLSDDVDHDDTSNLKYKRPSDNFNRSVKPIPGTSPVITLPKVWKEEFKNGLVLMGSENNEIASVSVLLSIEAGHKVSSGEPSKSGLVQLMADLFEEGTIHLQSDEFSETLRKLGADIRVSVDLHYISFSVNTLSRNYARVMELLRDQIQNPPFIDETFDRIKKRRLENIANQATQSPVIAANVFNKLMYGPSNITGIPVSGSAESVAAITLNDLTTYHKEYIHPSHAHMVVVGDIEKEEAVSGIKFLQDWPAAQVNLPAKPKKPQAGVSTIYLINKDKAPHSELYLGRTGLPFDVNGDFYKSNIMNFALGGNFSSRINLNLREEKGFTYGARSRFTGDKWNGLFIVSTSVRSEATDSSISEILKELNLYKASGLTRKEHVFTKSALGQNEALKYETLAQKASLIQKMLVYNLNPGFTSAQNKTLQRSKIKSLNKLAKRQISTNDLIIVVVGNREKIFTGLKSLGMPIVVLDVNGDTLDGN